MKKILFAAAVLVFLAVLSAGCTGSSQQTPAVTDTPAASSEFSLIPTPTDAAPSYLGMNADASKDPITAKITVISRGGSGLNTAVSLDVTAYLSDGRIETKTMKPDVGTECTFDGTKGTDRVTVSASFQNGNTYKIYDDQLIYKQRTNNQ